LIDSLTQDSSSWEVSPKYTEDFNKFWKTYPSTDGFGNFPATRNIRIGKKDAFKEWNSAIAQGYTSDQIINGLVREIEARKNSSTFRGGNNLKFMKSPVNYLKQKAFLDYEEEPEETEDYDSDDNYA
jgi:hypothetical protein